MSGTFIFLPPTGGGGSSFISAVADTDSIDLTVTSNTLTADLLLSGAAATAGNLKALATIETDGLLVQVPYADTSTDGVLSAADWNTFNNKEPAIASGTTADYWRGDKTFQLLQMSALTAVTNGSSAAVGKIGEILTASQAANTTTGIGASGTYGAVTSLSITAGVWYVFGTVGFNENGAVLTTGMQCGISNSATGSGLNEFDTSLFPGLISSTSDLILATPGILISINATTTYYLNSMFYYTSGTPQHRGKITAWRIR